MYLRSFIFIVLTFGLFSGFAQNQANIWYFGKLTGLDFNSGEPEVIHGPILLGSASVMSDSAGNLLFAANADSIWNRNLQIMQNGEGLTGHFFAQQTCLIVQKPGSDHLYYVFTTGSCKYGTPLVFGLYYSVVDMTLDNGLGAVTDEKNISLYSALQANAMLFGFSRPWRAADLYLEVAADADAAADSLVGARALYGAALVYQEYLDNPDSADLLVAELQERYPDSPQAYVMSVGNQADLLTHLLEQDDLARAASGVGIGQVAVAGTGAGLPARLQTSSGLRRRMFYYQRKPNLILAPPPGAVPFEPALDLFEVEEQTESVLAPAQTEAAPADTMGVGLLSGAVSDTTDTAAGLVDTAQAAFAGTAYDTVQTTEPAVQAEALPDSTQAETPATSPDTPESAPPDSLGPGGEQ